MNYLYTLLLMMLSGNLFGQLATLKGNVKDASKNEAMEFATISLRNESDSSKVTGGKSKAAGAFLIEKIPFGKYTITVSSIGYKSKTFRNYSLDKTSVDLGSVALDPSDKSLKEVNIIGEKSAIEIGIDKKTFNVDKNITSAGGTATDLLRNVPSVNVDMDGNLSLRGKDNVTLLVDGKPSSMFGNDPQTALQAIPASSIESIEVITNPSSKYEAQGMSGIINIILKKDRKAGYNGMFNVGLAAPYRLNGGINLNANRNRWNFFINANARHSRVWEKTRSKRDNYDDANTFRSSNNNDREPLSIFMNLGAEYRVDNRNKFTLSQNIFNANMRGNRTN